MRTPSLALPILATTLLFACKSTESGAAAPPSEAEITTCICGEPEAKLTGCYYEPCAELEGNPENPECLCAGIGAVGENKTYTSTGDAQPASRFLGTPQTLYLTNGNTIKGTLQSDDGLSIQMEMADGSTRTIAYSDLDPKSVFRLMRGRANDNGPASLAAANYARDHGWYAHAKRLYQDAYKLDPALGPQVEEGMKVLRDRASQEELTAAQTALNDGDTKQAEDHIQVILREFPDETATQSATALLAEMNTREASMSRSTPDMTKEIEKALRPAQAAYDRAKKANHTGLTSSRTGSSTERSFNKAIKDAQTSRKEIEKIVKKNADEGQIVRAADQLDNEARDLVADASMNLASLYMTRTSYQQALRTINNALATDPKNAELLNMRARIEDASSRGWGGGWVVVR